MAPDNALTLTEKNGLEDFFRRLLSLKTGSRIVAGASKNSDHFQICLRLSKPPQSLNLMGVHK
jgi:hypothetical protein